VSLDTGYFKDEPVKLRVRKKKLPGGKTVGEALGIPPDAPKRKFRVHFSQVNQTYMDLKATDEEAAVAAAIKRWRSENWPRVDEVREI